jgi:hypothetical protein
LAGGGRSSGEEGGSGLRAAEILLR